MSPTKTKDTKDGCALNTQHVLDLIKDIPIWIKVIWVHMVQ